MPHHIKLIHLTGRSTRSTSVASRTGSEISVEPVHARGVKSRGRRSTLNIVDNDDSSRASSMTGMRRSSRRSGLLVTDSEPVSSVATPADGLSDDEGSFDTPATSNNPTPSGPSQSGKSAKKTTHIEVHLPSLPADMQSQAIDGEQSEVEDASTPNAAENVKSYTKGKGVASAVPRRQSGRFSATLPNRASTKRQRASTLSSPATLPPTKRNRVVPDSDEISGSEIDIDAEIAAAAALDVEDDVGMLRNGDSHTVPDSDSSSELSELEASDSGSAFEIDSEDEPLSKGKGKQLAQRRRPPSAKPPASRTRTRKANTGSTAASLASDVEMVDDSDFVSEAASEPSDAESASGSGDEAGSQTNGSSLRRIAAQRRAYRRPGNSRRVRRERDRLESNHPELKTMWTDLENMPVLKAGMIEQPNSISRQLKPFQLEGVAWMKEMEKHEWKGGLLGDEMGLGKTIQAVSLIMSDYPAKQPSLVLVPPVALMQWQSEIKSYTDGTLKTFVFHGTNQKTKGMTIKDLKQYDVIMMSYNSLESIYRKQQVGFKRKDGIYKEASIIHGIKFHRVILDEAHCIKTRTTMTAKACFALQTEYRWCLTGTPLQNRIGEFFSLIRFLNIQPFASYLCKQCPCAKLEWSVNDDHRCTHCDHGAMQHVSVFNQELLNPIQKFGNLGPGREAFRKLRLMTDRIMLRRLKRDHTNSMELPVKEIYVDRQFFGEEENDFANSIMTNGQRKFDTYVAQGVLLNNYANIFGLIMQMRQVADHPDLILKKNADGGQNILVCCICDEPAEDTVRSRCKHDFCRACVASYVRSTESPDCPRCHIALVIDLEQPEIEQDEALVKKSSIINRIKMENWTSSSKIELLVHELHRMRSNNATHKSIIFSQFTTMLQLIEWRLRRAGITTVMLDGSMTPAQRQASIEHFMNNIDVECFLVSLKAGGVALNLTEASRVFIVDP